MGRYYGGTITGKWAFGLLSSGTPDIFHPDGTSRKNYRCPYGDSANGDDTDFSDSEMPEDLENDADWTDEQREFMDIHRECVAAKEMKCNNEREDELCYDFDAAHYDYVVQRLAEQQALLPGRSFVWAQMDFNDLVEFNDGDVFGPDNETYQKIEIPEPFHARGYGESVDYFKFPYCKKRYEELSDIELASLNRDRPAIDLEITGTPKMPVCCVCKCLEQPSLLLSRSYDKKETKGNPFRFKRSEWTEGERFSTVRPYFCYECAKHWFWDDEEPEEERRYYFLPNCSHSFRETAATWSFGEQLRQALHYGDVFICSEP